MSRRRPGVAGARGADVRRGVATATALIATMVVLTGCGITVDAEPRQLDATSTTTTTVAVPSSGTIGSVLY
ncbi:hypothetical protein BH10ACT3_BH10ACT3_15070 [soil metagenome]